MEEKKDKEKKDTELVRVLEPSGMLPKEPLTTTDILAYMLMKDFISTGYPSIDAVKQVDAAYSYAELMTIRRRGK